jgi:uncharacterized protein YkuJ
MSEKPRHKSNLSFLHEKKFMDVKNGVVTMIEEVVRDGSKGISFKYFHKEGDKVVKIQAYQTTPGGEFEYKEMKDKEASTPEKLTLEKLIAKIDKKKELKFALDYLKGAKKQAGGYYSYLNGGKRKSKKGSKKSSRKGSKKSSRKGSKKHMWGGKRRSSRKGSKKASKKSSKKRSRRM